MRFFSGGRAQRAPAAGSGVIVSPDGYVLTNFHVAGHTSRITCTLSGGQILDASVVADDPLSDLSVLKLRRLSSAALPWARLGDSDTLQIGDAVLAMGNPLTLSSSMTLGIVSNTRRVFTDFTGTQMEDMELDPGEKTGLLTRWIQHDALILPGNSGGPLVNLAGDVVGINELGGDGVGFAIPSNIGRSVLTQAVKFGRVRRGWLGLSVLPVAKLGRTTGALVASVQPGAPAAAAGILPGDIVTQLNGQPVQVRFFDEAPIFYQRVAQLPIGAAARVSVMRNGQKRVLTARVASMPPSLGAEQEFRSLGVTVRALTPLMALARHLPDTRGVLVTGVRPGYPFESAQPPLNEGDVIEQIGGQPTPSLTAFRRAVSRPDKTQFAVRLRRKDETLVAIVRPGDDKTSGDSDGGELPQAWLGIKTQVVTPEVAQAVGAGSATGFRITEVLPYTEAARVGLKPGDIVTALNGSALDAARPQDAEDLRLAVQQLAVGEKARLTVQRGAKKLEVPVTLERAPASAAQAKTARSKEFEFTVRDLTLMDKIENHWPRIQQGVLVVEATSGGWANIAGLHIDDLIVSLNGHKIADVAAFGRLMPALVRQRPRVVQIFVRRDTQTQFVFIEPDWSRLAASE